MRHNQQTMKIVNTMKKAGSENFFADQESLSDPWEDEIQNNDVIKKRERRTISGYYNQEQSPFK